MEGREGTLRRPSLDVIGRLLNQALAGLNYLLTLAVSVVVIIVAVVAYRSLVDDRNAIAPAAGTTAAPTAPGAAAVLPPAVTAAPALYNCTRTAPQADDQTRVFRLYYACGPTGAPNTAWVYRSVGTEGGLLTQTMQELVAGPTLDERGDGFRSLFSTATAGAVLSVTRDEGSVVIDLRDLGPMPSLSTGREGTAFIADLNNTIFQHTIVAAIEYRIEGNCDRFWEYFDETGCSVVARGDWQQDPLSVLP